MKLIVCAFLAIFIAQTSAALSAAQLERMQALTADCMAAESATDEDAAEMMTMQVPSTGSGACLNACMMERTGITVDGQFSVTNSVAAAESITDGNPTKMAAIREITAECGAKLGDAAGTDRCAYAKRIAECNTAGGLARGYVQRDLLSP